MKKVVLKTEAPAAEKNNTVTVIKYMECQKNQAVHIGGHAVDGCNEFLATGPQGTDALTCACCGCHRSFHRRQVQVLPA